MSYVHLVLVVLAIAAGSVLVACGSGDSSAAATPPGSPSTPENTSVARSSDTGATNDDLDLVFIDAMIVHHQSAISMAEIARESAARQEVLELADDIIRDQHSEIEQMMKWRDEWYEGTPDSDLSEMMHMAGMHVSQGDMDSMRHADDIEMEFMDQMIPHHEAAVEMARSILETTEREELRELAEAVIGAQTSEIEQMREWMREWSQE